MWGKKRQPRRRLIRTVCSYTRPNGDPAANTCNNVQNRESYSRVGGEIAFCVHLGRVNKGPRAREWWERFPRDRTETTISTPLFRPMCASQCIYTPTRTVRRKENSALFTLGESLIMFDGMEYIVLYLWRLIFVLFVRLLRVLFTLRNKNCGFHTAKYVRFSDEFDLVIVSSQAFRQFLISRARFSYVPRTMYYVPHNGSFFDVRGGYQSGGSRNIRCY